MTVGGDNNIQPQARVLSEFEPATTGSMTQNRSSVAEYAGYAILGLIVIGSMTTQFIRTAAEAGWEELNFEIGGIQYHDMHIPGFKLHLERSQEGNIEDLEEKGE